LLERYKPIKREKMRDTEISAQAKKDLDIVTVLKNEFASNREKQKAFNDLYARYQKQIGIYFAKQVRDADSAEDLKMVTFEKVHEKIASYDSNSSVFSTWMYTIAKNVLIDHKRKDKFEVLSIDVLAVKVSENHDGMEFQIAGYGLSPEQEMVRDENIALIRRAIESITNEKIRKIMNYRFIDELSFKEIAELEGVSEDSSTLRVHSKRGLKILAELLS
jgi:RNA polymerase sigma-70 factor (ECF subfamily)